MSNLPYPIREVAEIVELLDNNEARVRWMFNPVPQGETLLWDHRDDEVFEKADIGMIFDDVKEAYVGQCVDLIVKNRDAIMSFLLRAPS